MHHELEARNPDWLIRIWPGTEVWLFTIDIIDKGRRAWNEHIMATVMDPGSDVSNHWPLIDAIECEVVKRFGTQDEELSQWEASKIVQEYAANPTRASLCLMPIAPSLN